MGRSAENNQFFKGKEDIIEEFSNGHRSLLAATAGRNFLKMPGYLHETSMLVEVLAKKKLLSLNYQIVADAIERELKQTGHDYSMAYKTARVAFELEKQALLTALRDEFADIDATHNLAEEELNRRFVELDVRRILLITTKTALDIEMEGLRQEATTIDRLTFANETLLINEKVATATAKLAVIPYIEELIDAQGRLLSAEESNIPYIETLADQKELLADKKLEVVPYYENKATASTGLAAATTAAMTITEQRLALAVERAALRSIAVDGSLDVLAAEEAVEALRAALSSARASLRLVQIDRQIAVSGDKTSGINQLSTAQSALALNLSGYKVAIASGIRAAKRVATVIDTSGDEAANIISVDANQASTRHVASYRASATRDTAMAGATAKITSKLVHLIGG